MSARLAPSFACDVWAADGVAMALASRGWVLLPRVGEQGLARLPDQLGARVIHETIVEVRPGRALVTSDRALDFHTDHHRADWIAWWCVRQTDRGGETKLADAEAAYATLSTETRAELARIRLFEHSLFTGDDETFPLVEERAGRRLFYCSFWLGETLAPPARRAFDAFVLAVRAHEVARFRLAPGDVLLIDNRRILHARTAIEGTRDRRLVRHWLGRLDVPSRPLDPMEPT